LSKSAILPTRNENRTNIYTFGKNILWVVKIL
jgi:hypothetical protein